MTRLWQEGDPIDVVDEDGQPRRFTWRGRSHEVDEISRQWRADLGWWADRKWHAYFKLVTDTGLLVIIFEDLETGTWYLQRLYD